MPCYKYLKFKHMGTEKAICNMEVLPRQVYEKYALVPGDRFLKILCNSRLPSIKINISLCVLCFELRAGSHWNSVNGGAI